jgi:hypothetical protein
MKKINRLKTIALLFGWALMFTACDKESKDETITVLLPAAATPKIVGEWEVYKIEKQNLQLDIVDGQLVHTMEWFAYTSPTYSDIQLSFSSDNTFEERYAGVLTNNGTWVEVANSENEFTFTFSGTPWSEFQDTYTLQMYCDSTLSIKYRVAPPAGNHDFQTAEWYEEIYYKRPGANPCEDSIEYNVQ